MLIDNVLSATGIDKLRGRWVSLVLGCCVCICGCILLGICGDVLTLSFVGVEVTFEGVVIEMLFALLLLLLLLAVTILCAELGDDNMTLGFVKTAFPTIDNGSFERVWEWELELELGDLEEWGSDRDIELAAVVVGGVRRTEVFGEFAILRLVPLEGVVVPWGLRTTVGISKSSSCSRRPFLGE